SERIVRAERPDLERWNRPLQIIDRAGRAGPVIHAIDGAFDVDVVRDVVTHEEEIASAEVGDVREIAREQIVDADHGMALVEQALREMRADESGGSRDDDSHAGW